MVRALYPMFLVAALFFAGSGPLQPVFAGSDPLQPVFARSDRLQPVFARSDRLQPVPANRPAEAGHYERSGLVRFTFTEAHMGTQFKIIVYAPDESAAGKAAKAAYERIAALDRTMSDYLATSELMRLCRQAGGEPVRVSEDLFLVLSRAQEVSRQSDGAFDVTVGPLVRLWRRARYQQKLPAPEELARARALVGYDKVRLNAKDRTVQLLRPGMQLDLGGIAKGYAADAALAVLKKHGVGRALVAAGGDIAVSGPPPEREGWTVGIAPLEDPERKPSRNLVLQDAAVSTSGDAEQFVEIGGKRYSHIVNPRTGLGLQGRQSVTVVAPNGLTADPLTKVVSVLGPERGFPIIEKADGVSGLVVRRTEKGNEVVASKRFVEAFGEGNSKSEIRNPKQTQNSKPK